MCDAVPAPVGTPARDEITKRIMDTIKATSCTTSLDSNFGMKTSIEAGFGVKAENDTTGSLNVSRSGCETLNVLSKNFSTMQKQLACTLTKIMNKSTVETRVSQTITVEVNNSIIRGNFDISQSIVLKQMTKTEFDTSSRAELQNDIKTILTDMSKQANDVTSEFGSVADSVKSFGSVVSAIDQLQSSKALVDTTNQILNDTMLTQNLVYKINNTTIYGDVRLSQDLHLELVSGTIVSNVVDIFFKQTGMSEIMSKWVQDNKVVTKGFSDLTRAWMSGISSIFIAMAVIAGIVAIVMLRGSQQLSAKMQTMLKSCKWIGIIVGIIGLVMLILGCVYSSTVLIVLGVVAMLLGIGLTAYAFVRERQINAIAAKNAAATLAAKNAAAGATTGPAATK